MAKYLILIYGPESAAAPTPEQWDQMMQAHGRFAQAVDEQGGKILGGEALQPTTTATSIRNDPSPVGIRAGRDGGPGWCLAVVEDSSRAAAPPG
jgi:hypothetical protein